jgi:4-hydroxy-3-methylbut-2-enyl diphosphate reductase
MIHNPEVNANLEELGVKFLLDTDGNVITPLEEVTPEDVVIIPAFGTTLEIKEQLIGKGIEIKTYDTTCPFVTRVWVKAEKLGKENYTIIIHGRPGHEETRATFSHSREHSPSLIIKDIGEAKKLGEFIKGTTDKAEFEKNFKDRYSASLNPENGFNRIGVINQTTMLAEETQEITVHLKNIMAEKYGSENINAHFADTRDTLCYATNENQDATHRLLEHPADLAIVVGGYNSSNTSHIVELCEQKFKTFFISSAKEIVSDNEIHHFDLHSGKRITTSSFLPDKIPLTIALTSGASCPDAMVEDVLLKILGFYKNTKTKEEVMETLGVSGKE